MRMIRNMLKIVTPHEARRAEVVYTKKLIAEGINFFGD